MDTTTRIYFMNYLKTYLPYLFGNKEGKSYKVPEAIDWEKLNFEETLMFHALRNDLEFFTRTLSLSTLSSSQIYQLFSFKHFLDADFFHQLKNQFPEEAELFVAAKNAEVLNKESVQELLNYKNYELSLFAIFDKNRLKPGKIFIRKSDGRFLHKSDGSVWSVPVLGVSGRGLPFNHSNGGTPCGVYTIDSVMPEANKNYEFGAFRRLIVNFLPKTPNEEKMKQFLPMNHYKRTWWIPCLVGRELGRNLLRIHGTGRVNKNPFSSHFPMIPSSGCI
ncbi:MAG: hypothetical protein K2X74_10390, partial [Acetobacteraceae bacterium]|nr:hypothetical protein [Acetobacteraceae bacterium]